MHKQITIARLGISALVLPIVLVACSATPSPPPATKADAVNAARQWLAQSHYSSGRTTIPTLIRFGATAVRIKVTSIEGPIWNSSDGRAWKGNGEVAETVLSRVTATVEDTLRGKPISSPLSFYTLGDATTRYESEEAPPTESISGGFTVGKIFVVFILEDEIPFEDRVERGWFHAGDYQANWRLQDDQAIAPMRSMSMPAAALNAQIKG